MDEQKKAGRALSKKDLILRRVVEQVELRPLKMRRSYFQSLVTSIISQQLSTKAAAAIVKKFVSLFGKFPTPEQVLKMPDLKLRTAGLSGAKAAYIKNLALSVKQKQIDFKKLSKMEDEALIETLVQVKGIGRWTAEMFLIFSLNRANVFSHGDLGLKNAIKKLYRIDHKLHKREYQTLIDSWHPHKSLASRYLWKSLEMKDSKE